MEIEQILFSPPENYFQKSSIVIQFYKIQSVRITFKGEQLRKKKWIFFFRVNTIRNYFSSFFRNCNYTGGFFMRRAFLYVMNKKAIFKFIRIIKIVPITWELIFYYQFFCFFFCLFYKINLKGYSTLFFWYLIIGNDFTSIYDWLYF